MTLPDVDSIVHVLASLAPIVFGVLLASVIGLNLAAFFAYRRVAHGTEKLEEAVAEFGGDNGKVANSLARGKATLQDIDDAIAHFQTILDTGASDEQKHEAEQRLADLAGMRLDQIADIAIAEEHARKFAELEPEIKRNREDFRKLQETVRSNPTLILFLTRWLEYFGNGTPANTSGKHRKEHSDD